MVWSHGELNDHNVPSLRALANTVDLGDIWEVILNTLHKASDITVEQMEQTVTPGNSLLNEHALVRSLQYFPDVYQASLRIYRRFLLSILIVFCLRFLSC